MEPQFTGKPIRSNNNPYTPFSSDLDQLTDTPTRRSNHRRSHSETLFRFSNDLDDFLFLDEMTIDNNNNNNPTTQQQPQQQQPATLQLNEPFTPSHLRSLSVDADFFEGLSLDQPPTTNFNNNTRVSGGGHVRANSMDGYSSATSSAEMDSSGKKGMADDRLSELALVDPKRAKRILANRQSAARSKERKVRYTGELERKVQTLQSEATTLSAKITLMQRDATGLTTENKELKLKLQALEQQAHLRDALNETLRDELNRLKIAAGQIPAMNGNNNRGSSTSQFASRPPTFNYFGNHLPSQQQQQQQQQQTMQQPFRLPHSSVPNNTRLSGQSQPNFPDFNHRA